MNLQSLTLKLQLPPFLRWAVPVDKQERAALRQNLLRVLIVTNLLLGFYYISWRYLNSINWAAWPIALGLLTAETFSYVNSWFFGLTMWRLRMRAAPPPPPPGVTVDVYVTCYNEPVELVRETVRGARAIRYPHRTYVLDDGNSAAMKAMAEEEGAGYIVRSADWRGKNRHAKAGNLNNALFQTTGEFILVLDADQIPSPQILDRTLGYFRDPQVAFVQTPQWFYNVPPGDPFGSQAPLFYGPIQQGKDGWNAAYFCGSNAVLRREALMQLGITDYVRDLEQRVHGTLKSAHHILRTAERELIRSYLARKEDDSGEFIRTQAALHKLRTAVSEAQKALRSGKAIQEVTWEVQRQVEVVSQWFVSDDLAHIRAELAGIPGLEAPDRAGNWEQSLNNDEILSLLARRETSPLMAIEAVRKLLLTLDMDRANEAQPVMPIATISVTEDMATAMHLHALGWKSVYHHEILARGLAPEDLRSALQQRLRWAQGTLQVLLRQNPLTLPGLSPGQRLMYFATIWDYLSGFCSVVYLSAPVLYLIFGISPVRAYSIDFLWHLLPYLAINQLVFFVVGWGLSTWRGQQYSLALFPIWIKAVTSAIGNVCFGKKLGFVVTPKTRQAGVPLGLIWPQIIAILCLTCATLFGLGRLAFGITDDGLPIIVNVF